MLGILVVYNAHELFYYMILFIYSKLRLHGWRVFSMTGLTLSNIHIQNAQPILTFWKLLNLIYSMWITDDMLWPGLRHIEID